MLGMIKILMKKVKRIPNAACDIINFVAIKQDISKNQTRIIEEVL